MFINDGKDEEFQLTNDVAQAAGKRESVDLAPCRISVCSKSWTLSVSELHSASGDDLGEDPSIDKNMAKMKRKAIIAPNTIRPLPPPARLVSNLRATTRVGDV